jgi:hypothetical protein
MAAFTIVLKFQKYWLVKLLLPGFVLQSGKKYNKIGL